MKIKLAASVVLTASAVLAQGGRENFLLQQTQAEMQRVSGQVDMLQNNFDEVQRRLGRLEGAGDLRGIRQEIDSLKAAIAELRREIGAQRQTIVNDLSGRLAKMQAATPPPPKATTKTVTIGPHKEYVVQAGDTLSVISQATGVPLRKIREMNNLKNDNLRVGQKLNLPL